MALALSPVGSRCPRARECLCARARAVHPRTATYNGSPALRLYSTDASRSRESSSLYADRLAATQSGVAVENLRREISERGTLFLRGRIITLSRCPQSRCQKRKQAIYHRATVSRDDLYEATSDCQISEFIIYNLLSK